MDSTHWVKCTIMTAQHPRRPNRVLTSITDRFVTYAIPRGKAPAEYSEHQHRWKEPISAAFQLAPLACSMDCQHPTRYLRAFLAAGSLYRSSDRRQGKDAQQHCSYNGEIPGHDPRMGTSALWCWSAMETLLVRYCASRREGIHKTPEGDEEEVAIRSLACANTQGRH